MKKTILITGASRGIGFAIAKKLVDEFDEMILVSKGRDNLDKATKNLKGRATLNKYIVNLENEVEIEKFTKEISKKFKKIDVLVNNAGVYIGRSFANQPHAEIMKMINLNLTSYILLTHQLLPLIKNGDNSQIINISSCAVSVKLYGEAVYTATKSGVSAFSDVLRKELNNEGIRITAIQPFGVDTYPIPKPEVLLSPLDVADVVKYIINLPKTVQLDVVEMSHIRQWRGTKPSWID